MVLGLLAVTGTPAVEALDADDDDDDEAVAAAVVAVAAVLALALRTASTTAAATPRSTCSSAHACTNFHTMAPRWVSNNLQEGDCRSCGQWS